MLYVFSELNLMDSDLTLSAAFLLGTIVSAVDPVAVSCMNTVTMWKCITVSGRILSHDL